MGNWAMQIEGFVDISASLRSGVYILVKAGKVVYVGQSKCMLVRAYSHRNTRNNKSLPKAVQAKGIAYDEVHVCPCHPDKIDQFEREMIDLYKPLYNTQHKTKVPTNLPFTLEIAGVTVTMNAVPPQPQTEFRRRI